MSGKNVEMRCKRRRAIITPSEDLLINENKANTVLYPELAQHNIMQECFKQNVEENKKGKKVRELLFTLLFEVFLYCFERFTDYLTPTE